MYMKKLKNLITSNNHDSIMSKHGYFGICVEDIFILICCLASIVLLFSFFFMFISIFLFYAAIITKVTLGKLLIAFSVMLAYGAGFTGCGCYLNGKDGNY